GRQDRLRQASERQHDDRDGGHARGQSVLRGQSPGCETGAINGQHDHRSVEELTMIEAISSSAISAGQAVARSAESEMAAPAASAVNGSAGVGFDSVLKQVTTDALGTIKAGEAASISAIQGKESTRHVVEALMSAEQALQTAVAVRDKVVQ